MQLRVSPFQQWLHLQYNYQWLNYSARAGGSLHAGATLEGPKLEPKRPRAQVVILSADQGFSSIQGILLDFYSI